MVLNSSKYGSSLQSACCPVRNSKDKATEALESQPWVQWTRTRKLPATWSRKSSDRGSGHNLAPPGSDLESSFKGHMKVESGCGEQPRTASTSQRLDLRHGRRNPETNARSTCYFSKWISPAGGGRSTGPGWERGLTVVGLGDQPPGLITVPRETRNSGKVMGPWQAVLSMQTARGPKRRVRKQRLGLGLKGITAAVRG